MPYLNGGIIKICEDLFITSDLHLSHKNIIKYCNRPYEFTPEGVQKMNEDMLKQFDELPEGATVINLGDIALSSFLTFDQLKGFVDRMKRNDKKLWLVLGNHDREMNKKIKELKRFKDPYDLFVALGFDKVFPFPILLENKYLLSHEPVFLKPGNNLVNLYGHVHNKDISEDYFCCEQKVNELVDLNNYKNMCWDKHYKILKLKEV